MRVSHLPVSLKSGRFSPSKETRLLLGPGIRVWDGHASLQLQERDGKWSRILTKIGSINKCVSSSCYHSNI